MDDIILPGGQPAKPTSSLPHNQAAKLSVVIAGDIRIVTRDQILIPEPGEWVVVTGPLWAKMVMESMQLVSQELEANLPAKERSARRRQRNADRRN